VCENARSVSGSYPVLGYIPGYVKFRLLRNGTLLVYYALRVLKMIRLHFFQNIVFYCRELLVDELSFKEKRSNASRSQFTWPRKSTKTRYPWGRHLYDMQGLAYIILKIEFYWFHTLFNNKIR
jgi:hypothetical protein